MKAPVQPSTPDPRHLSHGLEIPTESYSDQPYIVPTDDGAWLCCVTTGPGHEGVQGQHVVTLLSRDLGKTWSAPISVEPGDQRENSYAVMLKVPSGRIYIFYNHNTDNVREIKWHDGQQTYSRVDSLGHFVFKYSDDHGRSWSSERYDVPFRLFQCDRENVYNGKLCFFWNVGKPFALNGSAYVSLHKVGQMGRGFFHQSEGVLLKSDNLLAEVDPARIRWETLPDGEVGLRAPPGGGLVSEEQSYCTLRACPEISVPTRRRYLRVRQGERPQVDTVEYPPGRSTPYDAKRPRPTGLGRDGPAASSVPPQRSSPGSRSSEILAASPSRSERVDTPIPGQALSDGSIYCVYRGIDGYPVESYSRDGGHTWSDPRYKCYADGRRMKHPRAANFAWRCRNGRYIYWFHNHGGRVMRDAPNNSDYAAYDDRNPVWLSAGLEIDTPAGREIAWSQPEIVLYDDDPYVRISYPDFVEEDGRYFLTETQKDIARVHEIPADLLESMWAALAATLGQEYGDSIEGREDKLLLALPAAEEMMPTVAPLPPLPWFRVRDWNVLDARGRDTGEGLALELELTLPDLEPGRVLLDNRDSAGRGLCLRTADGGSLELSLNDGQTGNIWASDPVLSAGRRHHVVANIDGGPRIISFIIDGRFCDGGDSRQFGWGRFSPYLRHVNGAGDLRIAPHVSRLRIYGRVFRTSEVVARHHRHGSNG